LVLSIDIVDNENVFQLLVMMVHDQKNMKLIMKNLNKKIWKINNWLFSKEFFFNLIIRQTKLTFHCSFREKITLIASSRYIFNIQSFLFLAMIGYVNKNRSLRCQQKIVIYVYVIILRTCQHSCRLQYMI